MFSTHSLPASNFKICSHQNIYRRRSFAPTASSDSTFIGNPQQLPNGSKEIVDQAFKSCKSAWESGLKRQRVEMVLPLIGATDLDDWPGGIQQEFQAAVPLVESLLRQLKQLPGLEGPLKTEILDQGDAVGAWIGDNLTLILFASGTTMKQIKNIVDTRSDNALVIIVNPQWMRSGQVIDDFGILPWVRKSALEIVDQFKDAYAVQQLRINGDSVKWLFTYDQGWQVNVLTGPKESQCIIQSRERPTYQEVEAALKKLPYTMSSKSLMERIQAEAEFNRRTAMAPPPREE